MTNEQNLLSEEDYSKYTVYELKDELKERGLKVSGKKSDLVTRLVSDINSTLESVENVIQQSEEAVDALEIAAEGYSRVGKKIAEKDIKGAISELKDASDDIETAAEESMEAIEDTLETIEDLEEKVKGIKARWDKISKNQKLMVGVAVVVAVAYILVSGEYINL
tara:strand:+ start:506 stop:1000 length:495 start_codon:yes stop_codon:yes gene_type:complete